MPRLRSEMTPEQRDHLNAMNREWLRRRIEADPEYLEVQREKKKLYNARKKAEDPQKWNEIRNRDSRAYYKRLRANDPERARAEQRRRHNRYRGLRPKTAMKAMQSAKAALPPGLPPSIREEVVGQVMLNVMEGRYRIKEIPEAAKKELATYNRQNDHFKTLSLDAQQGDSKLTWLDNLPDDIDHF